jgi:hypothetical protein
MASIMIRNLMGATVGVRAVVARGLQDDNQSLKHLAPLGGAIGLTRHGVIAV